jgi:hypothetical protein
VGAGLRARQRGRAGRRHPRLRAVPHAYSIPGTSSVRSCSCSAGLTSRLLAFPSPSCC